MLKLMRRLTMLIFVVMLALPFFGCQPKPVVNGQPKDNGKTQETEKGLNVEVDAGKTKVKVESDKKPGEEGRRLDIEVERHKGHEQQSNDRDK